MSLVSQGTLLTVNSNCMETPRGDLLSSGDCSEGFRKLDHSYLGEHDTWRCTVLRSAGLGSVY